MLTFPSAYLMFLDKLSNIGIEGISVATTEHNEHKHRRNNTLYCHQTW